MTEERINLHGNYYTPAKISEEPDEYLRLEAADQGFALNLLINDKSPLVRATIARIKFGHAQLATDENWKVRATVAKHCKTELLSNFLDDENHFVRYVIVKRGVHLQHFINDVDEEIADLARYQLKKQAELISQASSQ